MGERRREKPRHVFRRQSNEDWTDVSEPSPTSVSVAAASSQSRPERGAIVEAVGKVAGALSRFKTSIPSDQVGADEGSIRNGGMVKLLSGSSSNGGDFVRRGTSGSSVGNDLRRYGTGGSGLNTMKTRVSGGGILRIKSGGIISGEPDPRDIRTASELIVEASAPSLPDLMLGEYGVDWYRDNVVLLTNSIRREILDLYVIVRSMHGRRDALKEGDIRSFFVWFNTFSKFFIFIMGLLETAVIPWVERSRELPEDDYLESEGGRMKVGKDITKTAQQIVKHEKQFTSMPPSSAFKKIHNVLKKWCPLLFGYINSLDEGVSDIVQSYCSLEECLNFNRWIANETLVSENKSTNVVLLVRFLDQRPRTLAEWKAANLDPIERGAHPQYWRAVAKDHFEVVAYFRRSTPSSQAQSRMRNQRNSQAKPK